jgi:hypothetical protein
MMIKGLLLTEAQFIGGLNLCDTLRYKREAKFIRKPGGDSSITGPPSCPLRLDVAYILKLERFID